MNLTQTYLRLFSVFQRHPLIPKSQKPYPPQPRQPDQHHPATHIDQIHNATQRSWKKSKTNHTKQKNK